MIPIPSQLCCISLIDDYTTRPQSVAILYFPPPEQKQNRIKETMKVLTSAIVLLQLGGAVYSYDPDLFSEEEEGWERSAICHDGAVNMTTTGKHVPCNERDTVADNCIKKEGWSVIEEPYHTPEDQQKCICNSDLWKLWKG